MLLRIVLKLVIPDAPQDSAKTSQSTIAFVLSWTL